MVEIKTNAIPSDEVDFPIIAEFTYNAKKTKFDQMKVGIEKIQEILLKNFKDSVFSYIFTCVDLELSGWLLLFKENDDLLLINPSDSLEGVPVIDSKSDNLEIIAASLLSKAIESVKDSPYKRVEAFIPITATTKIFEPIFKKAGFLPKLTYVDMECDLTSLTPPTLSGGHEIKPVDIFSKENLFTLFKESFSNGDSHLFMYQSESDRKVFFEELYIEKYMDKELSIGIVEDGELIAFSYVLEFEPGFKHISCMCVHPENKGKGVGKYLMRYIILNAQKSGAKKITLGTEPRMAAYHLYKNHGFKDIAKTNVYRWSKEDI